MNTNNQYGLPTVSIEDFANLICQVPEGKLTTVPDLLQALYVVYNGQNVFLDFPAYSQHPLWSEIPWWRIVSIEGELLEGITGLMEEQDKYLKVKMQYLELRNKIKNYYHKMYPDDEDNGEDNE